MTTTGISKKNLWVLGALLLFFFLLRVPGLNSPLHQDEYKWPMIVNPTLTGGSEIPHPPLSQFIYERAGALVGYDVHLRLVPLLFGAANMLLLWSFVRRRFGDEAGYIAAGLYTFSFFSILASLMVDTDGQILPFFFLVALLAYDYAWEGGKRSWAWWAVFAAALVLGFLVKVSFLLAVLAIGVDVLFRMRAKVNPRLIWRAALTALVVAGAFSGILLLSSMVFPFFSLKESLTYWQHFVNLDRNWLQTLIQVVKAGLYLSPLLLVAPFFLKASRVPQLVSMVAYIGLGLIFYTLLFDFSIGALDRYLQYLIVPLSVVAAVALWDSLGERVPVGVVAAWGAGALALVLLQFLPHAVPPLHPKAEWVGRIVSMDWTFLYPFSGGSGPLTFYISFLFIGVSFLVGGVILAVRLLVPHRAAVVLVGLVALSFAYNGVFIEEYLFGKVNGSAPSLVNKAVAFIRDNPEIERVVVYNDNGGDEVRHTGKYEKRLYTSPQFDVNEKIATMNAFSGHYLVIDAPPIDPRSVYARYLAGCIRVYEEADRAITATVYDCRTATPASL